MTGDPSGRGPQGACCAPWRRCPGFSEVWLVDPLQLAEAWGLPQQGTLPRSSLRLAPPSPGTTVTLQRPWQCPGRGRRDGKGRLRRPRGPWEESGLQLSPWRVTFSPLPAGASAAFVSSQTLGRAIARGCHARQPQAQGSSQQRKAGRRRSPCGAPIYDTICPAGGGQELMVTSGAAAHAGNPGSLGG